MKTNTSNRIRLGVFVSLGIALFIIGVYFIGERQQLFRSTFRVSGVFRDVSGLQAGNNVRLAGINVGSVENIRIVSDTSIRVEIVIDESTRKFIKKDAVASIGSDGLMGSRILIINPGTGGKKDIEDNDIVATVPPINMDDIMISLRTTIERTSSIASDLSKITNNIQSGKGTIGRLLMDPSLARNVDSSIISLKQGSEGLKHLMDDAKYSFTQNVDSALVNLKDGAAGFKTLVDKAKHSWLLWGF
jgi:phospholipid/cholesterol/gamma-HCH transport system substrate-binding protein